MPIAEQTKAADMDILLGPDLSQLLDSLRDAVSLMSGSRKSKPGGFLLSPPIHAQLVEAAHRWGVRADPVNPTQELMGLPFLVIDTWAWGWQLMPEKWWRERVKPQT